MGPSVPSPRTFPIGRGRQLGHSCALPSHGPCSSWAQPWASSQSHPHGSVRRMPGLELPLAALLPGWRWWDRTWQLPSSSKLLANTMPWQAGVLIWIFFCASMFTTHKFKESGNEMYKCSPWRTRYHVSCGIWGHMCILLCYKFYLCYKLKVTVQI